MDLRYIGHFLQVVVSIQCICLLVLTFCWSSVRKNISEQANKEIELFYRSKSLSTSHKPPDGCQSVFDETRNRTIVRGPGINILKAIVSEVTNNLYDDNTHPEQPLRHESLLGDTCTEVTEDNPVLKLLDVDISAIKTNFDGETSKIFWKSVDQAYSYLGLTYSEYRNSVKFQKPGLYFVMSQIQYRLNSAHATNSSINIKYRVHLISHKTDTERIILENESTLCEPITSHYNELQTISVGAIFKFDARDQLYVSTSLPGDVVTNERRNHLTIFVL